MNFEHLTNKKLKGILLGNPDKNEVAWAINYTKKCVASDADNDNVPYSALYERQARLAKADTLLQVGMQGEAMYFLKRTWEV